MKNLPVAFAETEGGYVLHRGGQPLATPRGLPLVVPSAALAEAMCGEWQGEKPNKALMRLTPIACVAVDLAIHNRKALLEDVVPYIDTDLVSYRAGDSAELQAEQGRLLSPLIAWMVQHFSVVLHCTAGVMPIAQPPENREKLQSVLEAYSPWKLAAFAVAVKPLGSAVLALALVEGKIGAVEAFRLAHLEEAYETRKWGADEEKEQQLAAKKAELEAIASFLALVP